MFCFRWTQARSPHQSCLDFSCRFCFCLLSIFRWSHFATTAVSQAFAWAPGTMLASCHLSDLPEFDRSFSLPLFSLSFFSSLAGLVPSSQHFRFLLARSKVQFGSCGLKGFFPGNCHHFGPNYFFSILFSFPSTFFSVMEHFPELVWHHLLKFWFLANFPGGICYVGLYFDLGPQSCHSYCPFRPLL